MISGIGRIKTENHFGPKIWTIIIHSNTRPGKQSSTPPDILFAYGNPIRSKVEFQNAHENDFEVLKEYDKDGKLIEEKWVDTKGEITDSLSSAKYEYSPSGQMIHKICANGNEQKWDDKGQLLFSRTLFDGGDCDEKSWDPGC